MKNFLLSMALIFTYAINAQNDGNTINTAIEVDGINADVNALDFNSVTASNLTPACVTSEDVFYKHITNVGENKLTIGMASVGTTAFAEINYQILVAPQNDMNQLQELDCDSYTVVILVGGSFQFVIDDIETQSSYYLRVFKPTDIGGLLTDLLNGSTITMDSEYDSSLSINDLDRENLKITISDDRINLVNNKDYKNYSIYSLDGKVVQNTRNQQHLETIDTSYLNSGLYILRLESDFGIYTQKFVKK